MNFNVDVQSNGNEIYDTIIYGLIQDHGIKGINLQKSYVYDRNTECFVNYTIELLNSLGTVELLPYAKYGIIALLKVEDDSAIVYISYQDAKKKVKFSIDVTASVKTAYLIENKFSELFRTQEDIPNATWYYHTNNGTQKTWISLEEDIPQEVHPEYYPWLKYGGEHVTPKEYVNHYLKSTSSILLLAGVPGTGKTSFLRWILRTYNLASMITYDKEVLETDEIFVDFISGERDVLIIEDSDLLLLAREASDNQLMSKFLNTSDGLIRLGKKKIIFTTNLNDFQNVDEALLRPGRCFDSIIFRPLTEIEAGLAAEKIGIENPHKSCTLAELFNPNQTTKKSKFGFQQ